MLRLLFLVFLSLCLAQVEEDEEHWEYSGLNGQRSWCKLSEFCCGSRQSPIGLYFPDRWLSAQPLLFINYTKIPETVEVTNNGHTVVVEFSSDVIPQIEEGGLKNRYTFNALHFHWGKYSDRGSEHTINGQSSPMEMHLVHYNSKFESLAAAVNSGEKDALAVLGVMFDTQDYNYRYKDYNNKDYDYYNYNYNYNYNHRRATTTNYKSYSAINKIASSLEGVRFNEQSSTAKTFSLKELLPTETNKFFRYYGSLTTPNCNEVVAWTVLDKPSFITEEQLKQFRSLYSTKKGEQPAQPLSDNFRSLQTRSTAKFNLIKTW